MRNILILIAYYAFPILLMGQPIAPMDGFPPKRETQVNFDNYRIYPYNKWAFRNMGAPLPTLMIPRSGSVHVFKENRSSSAAMSFVTLPGKTVKRLDELFEQHEADGLIVIKDNTIQAEKYWNGLTRDYQHIWYSITKSLTSTALGILVSQKKIDLSASPSKYVPELKGSAYDRCTIQDILNMSSALGFYETYTDTASFFHKYYGGATNFLPMPKLGNDATDMEVLGTYDFVQKKATSNPNLRPGEKFEYNSSNADVISWVVARVTGKSFDAFIQEQLWAKIGAEHDAFITADRAYTPMATGGMNSTLRDLALFGLLVLNRGTIDGKQLVPAAWIDETLRISAADKERFLRNEVYVKAKMPWVAYKNFWWILDEKKGEYAAVGINGQVLYINRHAKLVIAYFSSQPDAGSIASKNFLPKLEACRAYAEQVK